MDSKQTTTYTLHQSKKLMSDLFFLDILIKYIQNIEINKKYLLQKLKNIFKGKFIKYLNNEHKIYIKDIINKIFLIKSLNKQEKDLIFYYMNKFSIK